MVRARTDGGEAARCSALMSGASFDAMTPIPRLPATVHDRNDEHVIGLDGVEHGGRKDMNKTPPHILLELAPASGCLGNLLKGRFNARDEPKL